jgi:hypothetical protein
MEEQRDDPLKPGYGTLLRFAEQISDTKFVAGRLNSFSGREIGRYS